MNKVKLDPYSYIYLLHIIYILSYDILAMLLLLDICAVCRLMNIGAVLNGIAGTVPFAGPALLASVWFPPSQRATATAIASAFNYFGVGMAFIIGNTRLSVNFKCLKVKFLCPRHKMAGAYSVTPFRHSVLPDSVSAHYLSHTWRFSNEIWYIGLSREYAG